MGNHVCPWWLAYTFDNPLRSLFHKPEDMFSLYVKAGMTVADLGCGMGFFSLGLARMVKDNGRVLAIDLQPKMLEKTEKRARKSGLSQIISTRLCRKDDIGVRQPLDFALAFWVVHETPDIGNFLSQVYSALKPGGILFIAEPKFHVSRGQFKEEQNTAEAMGFVVKDLPRIAFSNALVFEKT
ncbi:MAG: class I SAM-dependent methyltransferase [Proteobacteria bacterium]|nr:class I SAM-dependent methyltransferase [Pseudomonadota bacterium]MBU1711243.1 class I SAM-dependent methyltransferase [Pseudomonadota bacterium]